MASHPSDPMRGALVRSPEPAGDASTEMARVEADIARTRAEVSRSVSALRQAVARRTDWREWVRRHPGLFLGAAFALGFFWGRRPPATGDARLTQSRRTGTWK